MSSQCEAQIKSGARCQKKTRHESKRCHHHRDLTAHVEAMPAVVQTKPKKSKKKPSLSEQGSDKTECCVCMEEMSVSDNLECGHGVCRGCISQLRNDKCPMCRRDVKAKHITAKMKRQMKERFQADNLNRQLAAAQAYQTYLGTQGYQGYQVIHIV